MMKGNKQIHTKKQTGGGKKKGKSDKCETRNQVSVGRTQNKNNETYAWKLCMEIIKLILAVSILWSAEIKIFFS